MQLGPHIGSDARALSAYIAFFSCYFVFALGKFPGMKIDRAGAAIIGAVALVALRILSPEDALRAVDFPTLVLLFSMMLIVANLHLGGFFEWIEESIFLRLRPRQLLPAVIFTSGILSAFLVNDVICLVMTPFIVKLTRRLAVHPTPYLLAVATASNIGSVSTITGNPQNMLIGSLSHIPYRGFLAHLAPVAIVGLFLDWGLVYLLYLRPHGSVVNSATNAGVRNERRPPRSKPVVVLGVVLAGFALGAPAPIMAALGAATLLITRTVDPHLVYEEIDWGLLVLFTGLFIIVGGAERSGLAEALLRPVRAWNLDRICMYAIVTAALSNLVSNVPAVVLLKSVVGGFARPATGWLTLAMASTLAGNLTITGSVANLIVVERARPEVEVSFLDYFRLGLPVTLVTLAFGIAWLRWLG